MGAVSPLGVGMPAYVRALREGRGGVRPLPFSHPSLKCRVAAMVWPDVFDPLSVMGEADLRRVPRLVPMALAACREALAGSGWLESGAPVIDESCSARVGLVLGTGGGGIDFTLEQAQVTQSGRQPSLWSITNATHGNLAGELSIRLGLRGPSYCVSTGCASSSDAAGVALTMLRAPGFAEELDAVLVVGADAHVRWETLYGMQLLGVISTRDAGGLAAVGKDPATTSRPFDRTRDGFVLGEGAWAMVLAREHTARRREAPPLGHLLGYAATCDAYHRVRPDPELSQVVRAMQTAVRDAGLAMTDVDLVHYHGTSTQLNDAVETQAVKRAFGAHASRLIGHSVKGAIGHPQGACGMAALCATLGALRGLDGGVPFSVPTINLREADPACDLDYTAREARVLDTTKKRVALVNCLAFGAKNSALVVGE